MIPILIHITYTDLKKTEISDISNFLILILGIARVNLVSKVNLLDIIIALSINVSILKVLNAKENLQDGKFTDISVVTFIMAASSYIIFQNPILIDMELGAILISSLMLLTCVIYEKITKDTEKIAFGGGDIKFMFSIGVLLGFENTSTMFIIFSAFLFIKSILKYNPNGEKLGPYLSLATTITFILDLLDISFFLK